jgi:hypothetical protein
MLFTRLAGIILAIGFAGLLSCSTKSPVQSRPAPEKDFLKLGIALMDSESLGQLKLGLSASDAASFLSETPVQGKVELWGADGLYHQEWIYPKQGITLGFSSEDKKTPGTIWSITVVHPCALKTKRGIRIGSSEAETLAAYQAEYNKEDSAPGESLVAGSIYGGLCFLIEGHRVSRIFIGAAAE